MESIARRADGRRIFSAVFKQEQLARVDRGELTQAELARELGVLPGLVRRRKHLATKGSEAAVVSSRLTALRSFFATFFTAWRARTKAQSAIAISVL
jgi:transposase-like protein